MPRRQSITAAIIETITTHGPLSVEELGAMLVERALTRAASPAAAAKSAISHNLLFEELDGGRVALFADLAEGTLLTVRIAPIETAERVVYVRPELEPLVRLAERGWRSHPSRTLHVDASHGLLPSRVQHAMAWSRRPDDDTEDGLPAHPDPADLLDARLAEDLLQLADVADWADGQSREGRLHEALYRLSAGEVLHGPLAWPGLPGPSGLVAIHVANGTVTTRPVEEAEVTAKTAREAVSGLGRIAVTLLDSGPAAQVRLGAVVEAAIKDEQAVLRVPMPPLSEALRTCGLRVEQGWVGRRFRCRAPFGV